MEIRGSQFVLRPPRKGDEESFARYADNPRVARNLLASFPQPYTIDDARDWIESCRCDPPTCVHLAIVVDGAAVGGIGYFVEKGVRCRVATIGYWLGEPFWGRGITTEALRLMTAHAFEHQKDIVRLEAGVYGWNPASARVLAKAGYKLEAIHHRAVCRDGEVTDMLLFVRFRDESP